MIPRVVVTIGFWWLLTTTTQKIRIIDSLGRKHASVFQNVKRWLKAEKAASHIDWQPEYTFETWPPSVLRTQQFKTDQYNCGVFLIGYVKAIVTRHVVNSFPQVACTQMRVDIFNWIVHGNKLIKTTDY